MVSLLWPAHLAAIRPTMESELAALIVSLKSEHVQCHDNGYISGNITLKKRFWKCWKHIGFPEAEQTVQSKP